MKTEEKKRFSKVKLSVLAFSNLCLKALLTYYPLITQFIINHNLKHQNKHRQKHQYFSLYDAFLWIIYDSLLTACWCSFGNKRLVTLTKPVFRNMRVSIHDSTYKSPLTMSMFYPADLQNMHSPEVEKWISLRHKLIVEHDSFIGREMSFTAIFLHSFLSQQILYKPLYFILVLLNKSSPFGLASYTLYPHYNFVH